MAWNGTGMCHVIRMTSVLDPPENTSIPGRSVTTHPEQGIARGN